MKDFVYMLAPMEDAIGLAFRELSYNHGADYTFTEMARVDGLARNNQSSLRKIEIRKPIPTYIQIIGSNEKKLEQFLNEFKPPKGFQGFNLNLGCPSPKMIEKGLGCALIKRISKVKKLVKIIKDKGYSASIKLRLGMNEFERRNKNYLNLIKEVDADFFIIHARDGSQTYDDPADFTVYEEIVKTGKKIIANGDIKTKEQVDELKKMGLAGVMIGRAAVENPRLFNQLKGIKDDKKVIPELKKLLEEYNQNKKFNKILKRIKD
ncbi:tRNA-dihydrouridine synthase family protein [Candidatus Woesearchaeota archaeon]|nr:tRNA-dihydrouridine synthase family protein [Candidatus Woesearchaeota archaeon]